MDIVNIGSRLELLADRFLLERRNMGDAHFHVHRPRPANVVLTTDRPWEHSIAYFVIFRDNGLYRMYYRGMHSNDGGVKALGEPMCYAESHDGIEWTKPSLGLFEFEGSADNNIVFGGDPVKYSPTELWRGHLGTDIHWWADFVPFKDERPGVQDEARYKALVRGCRGPCMVGKDRWDFGLYPFQSPDGLHWTLMRDTPVITRGLIDAQNSAFWDAACGRYVAFSRDVRGPDPIPPDPDNLEEIAQDTIRDIRVSMSDDFLHWTDSMFLRYPNSPRQQLYTSAIQPYERAPHLLIGFPTRFFPEGGQTEPIFMVSRDGGAAFHRWPDAVIPRDAPEERDGNRSNYMACGVVRGNDREFFTYATEGYKNGPSRRLRRFVWRVDGFVSLRARGTEGSVITRPLTFTGDQLLLNYAACSGGWVRVEIQDVEGRPLDDLALDDCIELAGDSIEQRVFWKNGANLNRLVGQAVRLRFVLRSADLFSFRFAVLA